MRLSLFVFLQSPLTNKYYHTENDDENPFICSQPKDNGMRDCNSVPKFFDEGGMQCNLDMYSNITDNTTCINWNQYYTNCSDSSINPFKGAINFDNIFYAWIAIFQVTVYSQQEGIGQADYTATVDTQMLVV